MTDCPRVGSDCPAFKEVKHEVKKTGSGLGEKHSGGLFAVQARTVRRKEYQKRPREKASGADSRRGSRLSAPGPRTVHKSEHSAGKRVETEPEGRTI
jgi:hypothetical protein